MSSSSNSSEEGFWMALRVAEIASVSRFRAGRVSQPWKHHIMVMLKVNALVAVLRGEWSDDCWYSGAQSVAKPL